MDAPCSGNASTSISPDTLDDPPPMLTQNGKTLLDRWIYVLVMVAGDFLAPFTEEAWERILATDEYGEDFPQFLERFLTTLAAGQWAAGSYFPGGWYRRLKADGSDPLAAEIPQDSRWPFYQSELLVDREGRWFVGEKPVTGRVLTFFLRKLEFDPALERYRVRYRLEGRFETAYLHHESPPLRVVRVVREDGGVALFLNNGLKERLEPDTLRMDDREELYCAVLPERLPAWFEEPARWELLKEAEEKDGDWVLPMGGREWRLSLKASWSFADRLPP